jgi:uncharacterized protein YoxC
MEMSPILQVALFLASLAVVVFVACVIPLAFQIRRNSDEVVRRLEAMKTDLEGLTTDTREMVQHVNNLCRQATQRVEEIGAITQTVRDWTTRAYHLVGEVGSALEPPVLTMARNIRALRSGVGVFLKTFMRHNHHTEHENEHWE